MTRILVALPETCTGCGACQEACAARHGARFLPELACVGLEVFVLQERYLPSVCFQCANPDCGSACPEGAIRHDELGTVCIFPEECSGCGVCVSACPWGQIRLDGAVALKCDLCGGEPVCVSRCASGALVFVEPEPELRALRGRQMAIRSMLADPATKRRDVAKRWFMPDMGLEDEK